MDDWPVYFHASEKLLGDLKAAYAQEIDFIMRTHLPTAAASNKDIIITGANGQELYSPITGKVNELPWMTEQFFFFTLHESHWSPKLTPIEFIAVLSNVTSIKIRGTYSKGDVGFLYTFKINTATTVPTSPEALPVTFVESCQCPEGHVGQFCESCAPGYRRERKFGGTMSKCVKCDCHGHSDSCDAESGACICQHNTAGETCESCARGYYGNALNGTENDCKACGCLGDGPCLEVPEGGTVCTDCPVGYTGLRCEQCAAEFYGNPAENRSCLPCPCNENIDMNAIGNCDSLTGQCLKCIYNTMGFNCEHCAVGFFGNATSEFRNECLPCQCYAAGTKSSKINAETGVIECNRESGQCDCKPHVTGHLCNECESGYFNITSGKGCQKCECFAMGSLENTCDITTGQCKCKPGVTGQKCDQCAPNHYGFGLEGCKPCECDGFGSENATCNVQTGQCPCKANVEGRRCDQCSENRFNIRAGCMQCDDCYTIIQSRKNDIVTKISELHSGLDYWENNKVEITDEGLLKIISEQVENIKDLKQDAFEWLDPTSTRAIKDFKTVGNKTIKALAKLRNLNSDYENLNVEIDDLEVQLKEFNKIKSEYQFQLNQDIQRLEDTGFTAANLAAEKLQLYGQNASQLDDLSREAEYYAKIETAAVDKLRNMIHEVDTKSMTAYVEAYDAVHNDRITPRIHLLREQTEELAKLWNETLASAEASVNESESVHDKAARALAKANAITVPIVDVDLMIKNLNESSHGVTESHKLYGKVNNIGGLLHQPVHSKLAKGKELLKEISRYKDEQDRNLKDLNDQLIRAEKAKKAVIDTVNQAEADIAALEEFNKNGPLFKPEFLEALEFVESIQNDTDFAVKLTSDIENMLGTAEADSIAALEISERFARQIDNAVQELEANEAAVAKINDDIAETKGIINKLIHDIEKVNDAMMSLEALEEVKQQHQAAARNASLAELQVKRAQKALDKSEEDLNSMTISLAASKPPSAEEIAELEKQLKKTSKLFRSKKSRRDLKKLRKTKLTALRDEVKAEYEALEAELEQLRQNFAELPDKCFNIVRLENSNEHF
uniref:Laminin EGF-like domain-containing protein n=1 Tax=Panagrellus redivivus TaxID=6233 RepID=A0A7E4UTB1_PANRE